MTEAEELHRRVRQRITAHATRSVDPTDAPSDRAHGPPESEDFDTLARALALHQYAHAPGYARLCQAHGVDPRHDAPGLLPAVPTDAFRHVRVATYPAELDAVVFRTSGTTSGTRGEHPMRTLTTYEVAATTWADQTLFAPWREGRPTVLAISPSAQQLPDSSLACMLAWFVARSGPASRFVDPEDVGTTRELLHRCEAEGSPVVVCATAFAWVHLCDALGSEVFALPTGSRAMQTGGFKGRTRELSIAELRAMIAARLGIGEDAVVGEYGMTELSSQLYATEQRGSAFLYRAPPWVRVHACDPVSLQPRPIGERGIARIEDLANIESAWAIQTADEVIVSRDGTVELLGRQPGAAPRGCSLAVEELLATRVRR